MKNTFTLSVLTLIFFTILATDLLAIPAFARKYNMSCKTCHEPFPKLKPYGNEFAGNGFQLKDKDAPRYYVDTGDDYLSLIRDVPLAMRLEGYVTYNQGNAEQPDFTAPIVFKLLSGGAMHMATRPINRIYGIIMRLRRTQRAYFSGSPVKP